MADTFDRGSAAIIEVEFKQDVAFGSPAYFDPITAKISVYDPEGTAMVTDANLVRTATGKWSYTCQTETDWEPGWYKTKVVATSGIYEDVTVNPKAFKLI